MKRCFVFSAGSFYGLRERPEPGDFVVAADAGYEVCRRAGVTPDLIIGDFDSMEEPDVSVPVERVPVEKDDTDTMLAVRAGAERGCTEFHLYGATGGKRLDHTLANFQTLLWMAHQGFRAFLYDDDFVYTAVRNGSVSIPRTVEWGLVSVFCLEEPARGVDEEGLQYPLHNAVLTADRPLAVSNHMQADTAAVSVREGTLIVGWELPARP